MHPDYLLPQLTSRQLAEWMAYFKERPFGQDYGDLVTAQVAALVYNSNRGKNTKPARAEDFLPATRERQKQTTEEMKRVLRGILHGHRKDN